MEKKTEIKFLLLAIISFYLHLVLFTLIFIPDISKMINFSNFLKDKSITGRDIIVNTNQNREKNYNKHTLLSLEDSKASGFITKKKGNRWLNNSLDFRLKKRGSSLSTLNNRNQSSVNNKNEYLSSHNKDTDYFFKVNLDKSGNKGNVGFQDKFLIPDKNDVTMQNAIYYNNKGLFSFNTAKFKNFKYFKKMKDKISSYWFPPVMANAILGGYSPGRVRIMAIPSQRVKLYFTMNRKGDVLDVVLLDSYGNKHLDLSCVDSIIMSGNFGKVPEDIKGDVVVIPFIFGYYAE